MSPERRRSRWHCWYHPYPTPAPSASALPANRATCSNVQPVTVDNQLNTAQAQCTVTAMPHAGIQVLPGNGWWARGVVGSLRRTTADETPSREVSASFLCNGKHLVISSSLAQGSSPGVIKTRRPSSSVSIPPYSAATWFFRYYSRYSVAGAFCEGGTPLLPQSACSDVQSIDLRQPTSYAVAGICANTTPHTSPRLRGLFTGKRTTHEFT